MQKRKSIVSLLESRRVNRNGIGLAITKEDKVLPVKVNVKTTGSVASSIIREERLSTYGKKDTFYLNLHRCMATSCNRFLPIGPITQPSLDGTYTACLCMFPENWKVEAISE
jgi:hypothetical protein